MELSDYIRFLRKRWIVVFIFTLVGLSAGAIATLVTTPQYQASTLVFVSVQSSGGVGELAQGNAFVQQQVKSYAEAANTPRVLDSVIDDLDLDETAGQLAETITASAPLDTVNIEITATRPDPEEAAEIANAVTASFRQVIADINQPANGDPSPITIAILRPATVPDAPISPSLGLNLLIGGLVGLILGLATAVVLELLDTRIHGERDVRELTQAPILAGIVYDRTAESRPLVIHSEPNSPRAEAFRALRTNLQFLDLEGKPQCFVITSSVDQEGKTTTTANLAIAISDSGARVLVIDADLRRPTLADHLGIEGGVGLSDVLIGRVPLESAVQGWGRNGLVVLPSGPTPPNPSELLGSQAMVDLLRTVEQHFDTVLLDAPPLLPVTDAAVLSKQTRGALLVVAAGRTKRPELTRSLATLENVGARVGGIIMTMVPAKGPDAYTYGREAYTRSDDATASAGNRASGMSSVGMDRLP
jgi:capsular exopolysaccharide synthesis family protein